MSSHDRRLCQAERQLETEGLEKDGGGGGGGGGKCDGGGAVV